MKTAVVILNWNGKKLLEEFLPSVVLHSKDEAEIYIVDNASTDDSIYFLEKTYPELKIIQNQKNGGYAKGYNEGLKNIEADLYVLLNSDVEVTENWLPPLVEQFKNNPQIAAAQPKILDYKNKSYFEYAGAAGGFIDKFGYPYCRGRIFNTLEKDQGQYDGVSEIFWASGACLFVRSNAFFETGGFDEDYFAHQEEIDLCWRLFNLGYKAVCVNQSKVYHLGGGTLKNTNPKKTYLNFRNSLFNLLKNAPKSKVTGRIFVRMLLDGVAGIQFVLNFKLSHFIAVLRAHLSFYTKLRKTLQKRANTSKKESYYRHKSIVFSYFVKQIKSFNNL
ncbi:MAG: glycosyltransferase family 2 protein [Flavobacteriaceae bacterium]|nr:glycosyltransferase family 2 protein [Flavobacteriaceae bacterium]